MGQTHPPPNRVTRLIKCRLSIHNPVHGRLHGQYRLVKPVQAVVYYTKVGDTVPCAAVRTDGNRANIGTVEILIPFTHVLTPVIHEILIRQTNLLQAATAHETAQAAHSRQAGKPVL